MMRGVTHAAGLALLLAACSGDEAASESAGEVSGSGAAIPGPLVEAAWQVRMSDDGTRAPFEQDPAWGQVFQRELGAALEGFSPEAAEGRAQARLHLDHAALYRQAALMGAHATVQVYEGEAQPTDPEELAHLVGVSKALLADCEGAGATLTAHVPAADAPYADAHAAWSTWVAEGCAWPPTEAAGLRAQLPEAQAGQAPALADLPHYRFSERTAEAREVEASDPSALLALSLWHEGLARAAAPEADGPLIDQLLAPWALPGEAPAGTEVQEAHDAWLFAGFYTSAADIAFVAAAEAEGVAAIEAWQERSAFAAALGPAVVDGRLDPEKVLDQAAALDAQLSQAMSLRAGGEQGYHRPFADLARVGALRAAMVVAEASGETRDSGVIRLNVVDQASGPTLDPVFSMATSAWDAGNRNPLRAQEAVHRLVRSHPSVAAARSSLDALHIRLSRTAAPATAAH